MPINYSKLQLRRRAHNRYSRPIRVCQDVGKKLTWSLISVVSLHKVAEI